MSETPFEKNLREFKERLLAGALETADITRIDNFIKRYPNKKWTRQEIIEDCKNNEKLCAKFSKDAMKQNLEEAPTIKKIGANPLPAGGKYNIRFRIDNGDKVIGAKAGLKYTKSADFEMDYNGKHYFGSQKAIHGSGGHQTSQIKEAVEFVKAGNKQHNAIAVVDGATVKHDKIYTSDEVVEKKKNNEDL
jgi:hypothetical protein